MSYKKYKNDLLDLTRKVSIGMLFYTKYILLRINKTRSLYYYIQSKKYGLDPSRIDIDPLEHIEVRPEDIKYASTCSRGMQYRWLAVGRIEDEGWNHKKKEFSEMMIYQSLFEHFEHGVPWELTEYYQQAVENISRNDLGWKRFDSQAAVDNFFLELDRMFETIADEGYRQNREVQSELCSSIFSPLFVPLWKHDEIAVNIDRNGELIFVDGRHRLAIAKILSVDLITVRVLTRHREWVASHNKQSR